MIMFKNQLRIGKKGQSLFEFQKIDSFVRLNACQQRSKQKINKLKKLQSSNNGTNIMEKKSFQLKKIQKYHPNSSSSIDINNSTVHQTTSTLQSLKTKIKALENNDHFVDQIRTNQRYSNHTQKSPIEDDTQIRKMIFNYKNLREKVSQFRSQKTLEYVEIKNTTKLQKQKQKSLIKTIQVQTNKSKDFLKNVYLKLVKGQDNLSFSMRQKSMSRNKKNMSLTPKRFYLGQKINSRVRTQMSATIKEPQNPNKRTSNHVT